MPIYLTFNNIFVQDKIMHTRTLSKPIQPAFLLHAGLLLIALFWSAWAAAGECPALLQHSFPSLQTGKPQNLCQYQGKVILVVNTASYCGHTDQYGGLEALYREYKDRGLVVIGFPSNDFGGQEPGSNTQIAKFCRLTYSVQFPMFEKSAVVGRQRNPFYAELERRTGQVPRWNFHKYLIDRDGERVLSFGSGVEPDDRNLIESLRQFLDARKSIARKT
jgi:glutathione peroxidase